MESLLIQNQLLHYYGTPSAPIWLIHPTANFSNAADSMETALSYLISEKEYFYLSIPVNDWNAQLSPWPAKAVFKGKPFAGQAEYFLHVLLEFVLSARERLSPSSAPHHFFLGGYSLAGLFALWASTQTDFFSGVAAISPSLWYPDWLAYAQTHPPKCDAVYLSLGDREEKTRHPVLSTVGDALRTEAALLEKQHISHILEWNAGNHFQDAEIRTAKGFAWLISQL